MTLSRVQAWGCWICQYIKGSRCAKDLILDHSVRIRHSALGISLSDTSCHHGSVHRTWPIARLNVINKRCSDTASSRLACTEFTNKLADHCPSHVALQGLYTNCTSQPLRRPCKFSSWLVLPFHPLYEKGGIASLLRIIFGRWFIRLTESGEHTDDLRVSIAWSLGAPSLKNRLKSLN